MPKSELAGCPDRAGDAAAFKLGARTSSILYPSRSWGSNRLPEGRCSFWQLAPCLECLSSLSRLHTVLKRGTPTNIPTNDIRPRLTDE